MVEGCFMAQLLQIICTSKLKHNTRITLRISDTRKENKRPTLNVSVTFSQAILERQ